MNHSSDIQLVQRLKEGDATAYDALFMKYHKLLCLNAYWFLRNEPEANDLVQTFFLDIWDKKLYLHFNGDIKGYLHQAIKNRCLTQIKKQKMERENKEAFTQLQEDTCMANPETSPDYYKQLLSTLNDMATQKRSAIQMVYIQGKRYQEAADEMGISINSFKTHLKRGLKVLRHAISNKGY
ncbi:RNA polymerase sigma-70 factor (ECF subfamily) [Chitinophaga niastensis]|uniref:RNA polymerase sigma-70 factor (ECF subfamily) n=1 Tax=Chitinophaga niastensis TaxID=536980 RepID=A0A2P8HNS5_CHINA|nr:sigma-70 family RNA polymerase sigma factor [Chitinophaga niastensis]PSL47861.1 RNA polymerase sigma-70 factor (ECF subfamily) [Chitinophaga niastensis]